jgi:hypothetical protein
MTAQFAPSLPKPEEGSDKSFKEATRRVDTKDFKSLKHLLKVLEQQSKVIKNVDTNLRRAVVSIEQTKDSVTSIDKTLEKSLSIQNKILYEMVRLNRSMHEVELNTASGTGGSFGGLFGGKGKPGTPGAGAGEVAKDAAKKPGFLGRFLSGIFGGGAAGGTGLGIGEAVAGGGAAVKYGRFAKIATKVPFIGGAIAGGLEYLESRDARKAIGVGIGSAIGGGIGMLLGPIGGIVGGMAGGTAGKWLTEQFFGPSSAIQEAQNTEKSKAARPELIPGQGRPWTTPNLPQSPIPNDPRPENNNSNVPDTNYSASEKAAKEAADKYIGRLLSSNEWDELKRATHAEAGRKNQTEVAMVMASILNRAKNKNTTIDKILREPNQFQAVTGTKYAPGPSANFRDGPGTQRAEQIYGAAANILPNVSKNQVNFTAASSAAYGPGTNLGYRDKMLANGGSQVGASIFNTKAPNIEATGSSPGVEASSLNVKGGPNGQAFAGGRTHPGVLKMASLIQASIPGFNRFTGFNDAYHKNLSSAHSRGLAGDFTINDPSKSAQAAQAVRDMAARMGLNVYVKDEYKSSSPHKTAGHIHYQFQSMADAQRMMGGLNGAPSGDTPSPSSNESSSFPQRSPTQVPYGSHPSTGGGMMGYPSSDQMNTRVFTSLLGMIPGVGGFAGMLGPLLGAMLSDNQSYAQPQQPTETLDDKLYADVPLPPRRPDNIASVEPEAKAVPLPPKRPASIMTKGWADVWMEREHIKTADTSKNEMQVQPNERITHIDDTTKVESPFADWVGKMFGVSYTTVSLPQH